jgi:DNA polymerase-3 subunit alpha (Gram-positive type)
VNIEKTLSEFFSEIEVPAELSAAKLSGARVNSQSRSMSLAIKMPSMINYNIFSRFKTALMDFYALKSLSVKTQFKADSLSQELIDIYHPYIIHKIGEKAPIFKYLFTDSKWKADNGNLNITIFHDGMEYIESQGIITAIEKIVFGDTGLNCVVTITREAGAEMEKPVLAPVYHAAPPRVRPEPEKTPAGGPYEDIILGKNITGECMEIRTIDENSGICTVMGDIFGLDLRELRNGKTLVTFSVSDGTSSLSCKYFAAGDTAQSLKDVIKKNPYLKLRGKVSYDTYSQAVSMTVRDAAKMEKPKKRDTAAKKRVELHLHTKMSSMDGVSSAESLVRRAKEYGHPAIAITDHGVVQSFPLAFREKTDDIKIIYGVEAYLLDDLGSSIYKGQSHSLDGEIVVFDIETTGLSPKREGITEIGAVKLRNGGIIEEFSTFVNPGKPVPAHITELTGITDHMLKGAPDEYEAVLKFKEFCGGAPLIAHNASFDINFVEAVSKREGIDFSPWHLDTLALCRALYPNRKRHRLNDMAKFFKIDNPSHHRAVNDAGVCAAIWLKCAAQLKDMEIVDFAEINGVQNSGSKLKSTSFHTIILAKNLAGLRNLYKLISISHLDYFYGRPRIPKSVLLKHRDGLLLGSACEAGELYRAVLNGADEKTIKDICGFYDYFEIQPLGNNRFLIDNHTVSSMEDLKNINREIISLGDKFGKVTVATGDVHFLDKTDEIFRRVLMAGNGFEDADNQAPLYFRTTGEMLEEFDYLGEALAQKVVIDNTNLIADMIEDIRPIPKESCPPVIEGSAGDIEKMCVEKAGAIYGDPLPEVVGARLEKELKSIIGNGFAVMYMIAHRLVKKSLEDGYMVGSRGSVGSSFVAFLTDITEVNALPPHYCCKSCRYSEFPDNPPVSSGCDMPDKACPNCGSQLYKDGHDIPFETFLGFEGDKTPDIDLNFSGDYQSIAHKYTESMFGEGYVFRAGTIGTLADKTAFGYVKNYFEERGISLPKAELDRITVGCTGVKRTTGQHPGGIVVLPKGHEIYEFTPIQHPADKKESGVITTHFEYHSIDQNLLKLDILGHDDPTVIKMLEDLTGADAKKISLADPDTISIFTSTKALGVTPEEINSEVGTFAVPEFGTRFVRQMLLDTKPKTFSDLIRISGLSHGADVWTNNAQDLVRGGTCTLSSCICTRDDIMLYLINKGLPSKTAFNIMESVRKGKGLTPEWEEVMLEHQVPVWYINSCKTIKYMFPKAHAAAYVTMAFRIAYFKVHHPLEFYISYFSVRADDFDFEIMGKGHALVKAKIEEFSSREVTKKEADVLTILEVCNEMYCRGISFAPIDLYKSDAKRFLKTGDGKILPPLSGIPGLGISVAESIAAEREKGEFLSRDELYNRTAVSKNVMESLSKNGCLEGMPETSQMSLF